MWKSTVRKMDYPISMLRVGGRTVSRWATRSARNMSHAPGLPQPASTTYLRTWQKVAMIAGAASVPIAIMVTKDSDADERLIIPSSSLGPRRITDFYKLDADNTLGHGQFGTVTSAIDKATGEAVAVKCVPRRCLSESELKEEIEAQEQAGSHPNIVSLKGVFSDDERWYIVMELARGGELYDRLTSEGALQKWEVNSMLREIISAVAHIHERGIVHGDIKPENILLREAPCNLPGMESNMKDPTAAEVDGEEVARAGGGDGPFARGAPSDANSGVLLADFGSSVRLNKEDGSGNKDAMVVKEYTAAYSAPEVVLDGRLDPKADVWSLGVIAYVMVKGYHPFDPTSDADENEIIENIVHAAPEWEGIDPQAVFMIQKMLSLDPKDRPTAKEVLTSKWLQATNGNHRS